MPSEEIRKKVHEEAMNAHLKMSGDEGGEERKRKWRRGEAEFEALMRHLDNMVCGDIFPEMTRETYT